MYNKPERVNGLMENRAAIRLENVSKTFGSVRANDSITMEIRYGEILSLLGENGSGKTTLMNMLSGIYFPDEGQIFIDGEPVTIRSPRDALNLGIGMVHQHFKLVDVFTAAENVILGLDEEGRIDRRAIAQKVRAICERYGFDLDPNRKVYDMTVSQKQTLEIVKVLYRGARVLILDEPTAVLTPQETEKLFGVIRNMRADGKSVVIITHKLHEVLSVSDRVAILRKGKYIGDIATKDANEKILTEMMVGAKVDLNIERPEPVDPKLRISVRNLNCINSEGVRTLSDVSFDVFSGEILGIAGISGCGQKELLEAIAGLQECAADSSIVYYPAPGAASVQLTQCTPRQIRQHGIMLSFVPEDRLGMGLVGSMGITENMMLKNYNLGHSAFTDVNKSKNTAQEVKDSLNVQTPNLSTPVRKLSGGNVQKVLVGREIAALPTVLMTAYAVRGLDINTSYLIYQLLNEQKKNGVAVVFVGEDLDVLVELCDKIMVLCGGRVNGILDGRTATKEQVGLLMTNLKTEATAK